MPSFDFSGFLGKAGSAVGGFLKDNAGALIETGVGLYGASRGQQAQQAAASRAAQVGQYRPQQIFSPFGNVLSEGGQTTFQAPTDPYSVLPPEMRQTSGEYADILGSQGDVYNQLGAGFLGALGSFDPTQAAQEQYDIMTQIAQPWEQRAQNRLQDQLFQRGQLGTSGGGIQQEAFLNAQNTANLQRTLAARDYAGKEQTRLAGMGTDFSQLGAGSFGARYGLAGDLLQRSQSMFAPLQGLGNLALGYGAPNIAAGQLTQGAQEGAANAWDTYGRLAQPIIGGIAGQIGDWVNPVSEFPTSRIPSKIPAGGGV